MRFWSEDRSLSLFLALLAIEMFIMGPVIRVGLVVDLVNDLLFSLLLLAGVLAMVRHGVLRVICGLVVAVAIVVRWTGIIVGTKEFLVWNQVLALLAMLAFFVIVLWQVYRAGPITRHRILGAVAAYLLLAGFFSLAYGLVEYAIPGSFTLPARGTQFHPLDLDSFLYFSVVTLTTVGFGDIAASHPFARSLVMLEAVVGMLYPAILIARLVSLQTGTPQQSAKP